MTTPVLVRVGAGRHLTMHPAHGDVVRRQGLDPVRLARQMGHARPSITLDIHGTIGEAHGRDGIAGRLAAAFGA
jgi:hypothetical protein